MSLMDLPGSLDTAVKNLTDNPTQNMGQSFGDLWYLVFGGISQAANKKRMRYASDLKKYENELSHSISSIPPDKYVEPSIQVAAQALENSKYCLSSECLRKMFVNLISGTMHADIEPHIHPSFPEILKQLSENDALMLQLLKNRPELPIANIGINTSPTEYRLLWNDICAFIPSNSSTFKCSLSISSLEHVGLIFTTYTAILSDHDLYIPITNTPEYLEAQRICKESNQNLYYKQGICGLTALGSEFILSCVS